MSGVDLNLVTVIVAGLIDGINPCAIAVLLVFVVRDPAGGRRDDGGLSG